MGRGGTVFKTEQKKMSILFLFTKTSHKAHKNEEVLKVVKKLSIFFSS